MTLYGYNSPFMGLCIFSLSKGKKLVISRVALPLLGTI